MYTIGQISKRFGLSRSSLLYYDSIGLLSPSARSEANYRLYTDAEVQRMEQIQIFRHTGLPLESIKELLQTDQSSPSAILARRLQSIHQQMLQLRAQQQVISKLLGSNQTLSEFAFMTKQRWVSMLAAAGLDEEGMWKWHAEFERSAPDAHQDFLVSLGIDPAELATIRQKSREKI